MSTLRPVKVAPALAGISVLTACWNVCSMHPGVFGPAIALKSVDASDAFWVKRTCDDAVLWPPWLKVSENACADWSLAGSWIPMQEKSLATSPVAAVLFLEGGEPSQPAGKSDCLMLMEAADF